MTEYREIFQCLEDEVRKTVDEEAATKYLNLAQDFATRKISVALFEKRAKGLVPISLHSKFILTIGDVMEISFKLDGKPKRKRKKSDTEDLFDVIYYHFITKGLCDKKYEKAEAQEVVSTIVTYTKLVDSEVKTNSLGFQYLDPIKVKKEISEQDTVTAVRKFNWLLPSNEAQDFANIFA
ncbi:unnamed protein product [Bursaphelenchus okinawaensis]|uniref:Uncharacterized protein n=1 Tax=Bursaphelenchus okinawaensis TaxID=465554 RepID=A0A811LQN6_9BILA|nr:unnamed protein product [Bursaphelenchus okinawaensis]CAG9126527.1 unnamed protein product [Bursaphelenchus okinawaensis]